MFRKSSRRLTPRKRFILWGGISLVFLVSSSTVILLANQKKEVLSAPLPKEHLVQAKNQTISEIKSLISDKKIKESDLLLKLKEEKLLKPNETDWKNCFNLEVANSLDKFDTLKKRC